MATFTPIKSNTCYVQQQGECLVLLLLTAVRGVFGAQDTALSFLLSFMCGSAS